jgi:hypothetical protein
MKEREKTIFWCAQASQEPSFSAVLLLVQECACYSKLLSALEANGTAFL